MFALLGEHNHRNAMIQPLNWVHRPITKIHHGRYVSARSLQPRKQVYAKSRLANCTTENIHNNNNKNCTITRNLCYEIIKEYPQRAGRTTCKIIVHIVMRDVTLPTNRQ